jgi:hypothetical protein
MTDNAQKAWELASEILELNSKIVVTAILANYIEDYLEREDAKVKN